jgi:ABC-type bacteriocin/lantibiotic exporter with double-glycine peptidase domain
MILGLPDVRQRDGIQCAAACVTSVARYFGQRLSLADATAALLTTDHDGADPSAIHAFFRRRGFKVQAGDMEAADLRHATRHGRPVVAVTAGHYVCVCGWDRGWVAVQDPACGLCWVPYTDFEGTWKDTGRWGATYDSFGLAVWRP